MNIDTKRVLRGKHRRQCAASLVSHIRKPETKRKGSYRCLKLATITAILWLAALVTGESRLEAEELPTHENIRSHFFRTVFPDVHTPKEYYITKKWRNGFGVMILNSDHMSRELADLSEMINNVSEVAGLEVNILDEEMSKLSHTQSYVLLAEDISKDLNRYSFIIPGTDFEGKKLIIDELSYSGKKCIVNSFYNQEGEMVYAFAIIDVLADLVIKKKCYSQVSLGLLGLFSGGAVTNVDSVFSNDPEVTAPTPLDMVVLRYLYSPLMPYGVDVEAAREALELIITQAQR